MNLTLKCKVSLSKKFRSMLGNNVANVNLNINSCKDGIGEGFLSFYVDDNINLPDDILNKETSIMLTPTNVEDELPNITTPVTSIFNNKDFEVDSSKVRTPVNRFAITTPPEKRDVKYAIKTKEELIEETPEEFKEVQNDSFRSYVSNFEELIEEINKSKYKTANIDVESITDPRKKAIAIEQKEMMEAITVKAYIVNVKCASLAINDLGIELGLNLPYDLSRISARRLAGSRDLETFIKNGMLKIISPEEVEDYVSIIVTPISTDLEVYDSAEDAEDGAFRKKVRDDDQEDDNRSSRRNRINLGDEDDNQTEEEKLISMTRVGQQRRQEVSGGTSLTGNIRKSSHSIGNTQQKQTVPSTSKINSAGIKTIAKKF